MLMKWEDLEPGDIIQYSDDIKEFYIAGGYYEWVKSWCDVNLIITYVDLLEDSIRICFRNNKLKTYDNSYISYKGSFPGPLFPGDFGGHVFKIISLKEK